MKKRETGWKRKVASETARELRRRSTPSEETLWQVLRGRQLGSAKFRRQHRIGMFVVDFCCVEKRLVVEVDGPIHRRTRRADRERQHAIELEGFSFLRIRSHDSRERPPGCVEEDKKGTPALTPGPSPACGRGVTAVGVREAKNKEWRARVKNRETGWKRKVASETARELRRRSTPSEETLWQVLRGRQLGSAKFRRQHRIGIFVVDFCCVEKRLVVEIDGPVHIRTRAADSARQHLIEDEGYRVVRISAQSVETRLAEVLDRIRREVLPSPPTPLPRAGEG